MFYMQEIHEEAALQVVIVKPEFVANLASSDYKGAGGPAAGPCNPTGEGRARE